MKTIYNLVIALGLVTFLSGCCAVNSSKNSCGPTVKQGKTCDTEKTCGDTGQGKTCGNKPGGMLIGKIYSAAKAVGATKGELEDIKLATHGYKTEMKKFHETKKFPTILVTEDEGIDKEKFMIGCKENQAKKAEIKYDYIDTVVSIFTGEKQVNFIKELSK